MLESQQRITGAVNNRKEFLLSIVLPGMFHMKGRRAGSSSPQAEMYTIEKSARKKKCSYSYGSRGESEAVYSTRECYSCACLFASVSLSIWKFFRSTKKSLLVMSTVTSYLCKVFMKFLSMILGIVLK